MKRRTLFSIIVITLTAGFFTLFYGMHSTWTDTRSAQAVQAATDQVNDLFKDQSHQLPSDQLNKQAIAAAETKLQQARQKANDADHAAALASAQADVDAAKHMLIVKDAVAQNATKLDELKTLSDKSQQALTELAKQKPTFVQTYQKRVAQLSDQEAAVAKIASLFSDTDFKTPKPNLSSAQVQAALAAVEKLDNKQFADQVMPLISTAQDATAGEDSRDTEPSASSVLPSSADSSQPSVADSSSQASSSTASSSESEQSQASSSTSTATSSSSQNP
jgi:peptidoglycan DL-endopeptidase CwlO